MHLDEALSLFLVQLDADGRSPHTIAQYARHVRAFERWLIATLRSTDLATITPVIVAQFFVDPAARCRSSDPVTPKKPTSLNAMRSTLRCFFAYAHDAGLIASNPARLLRRARCAPPPPRALSADEQDRLMAALAGSTDVAGKRDHALFHLLLATGLRLSSALALQVENLDLEAGELVVNVTKNNAPARVFLSASIREHLRAYLADRTNGYVFTSTNGTPIDRRHAHRRLKHWTAVAFIGRSASPHALRHSFATDLYQRTSDLHLVQQALAHRSIVSTVIYARCSDPRLRRAIQNPALVGLGRF